jgi:maltose O-acetyltransferase
MKLLDYIRDFRGRRYIAALIAEGLKLGNNVFLNDGFFLDPGHCHLIRIDDDVVFGPNVQIFAHDASSLKVIGKTRIQRVHLMRNCFIGAGAIILPGSVVGENSIIGAGSVLGGEVPDNQVWAGCPAKFLMTTHDFKEKLLKLDGVDFAQEIYRMDRLTPERRWEMVEKLKDGAVGFMVAK